MWHVNTRLQCAKITGHELIMLRPRGKIPVEPEPREYLRSGHLGHCGKTTDQGMTYKMAHCCVGRGISTHVDEESALVRYAEEA